MNYVIFLVIGVVIIAGLILFSIYQDKTDKLVNEPEKPPENYSLNSSWVEIEVTQCANIWDEYSYEQRKDNLLNSNLNHTEQGIKYDESIQNYFKDQGITVFEMKYEKTIEDGTMVCEACSCTAGKKLLLLIPNVEIDQITKLGFKISTEG